MLWSSSSQARDKEHPRFPSSKSSNDFNQLFSTYLLRGNTLPQVCPVLSMVAYFLVPLFIWYTRRSLFIFFPGCLKGLRIRALRPGTKAKFPTQTLHLKLSRLMKINTPRTWRAFSKLEKKRSSTAD